jgi:hypothetical protein
MLIALYIQISLLKSETFTWLFCEMSDQTLIKASADDSLSCIEVQE